MDPSAIGRLMRERREQREREEQQRKNAQEEQQREKELEREREERYRASLNAKDIEKLRREQAQRYISRAPEKEKVRNVSDTTDKEFSDLLWLESDERQQLLDDSKSNYLKSSFRATEDTYYQILQKYQDDYYDKNFESVKNMIKEDLIKILELITTGKFECVYDEGTRSGKITGALHNIGRAYDKLVKTVEYELKLTIDNINNTNDSCNALFEEISANIQAIIDNLSVMLLPEEILDDEEREIRDRERERDRERDRAIREMERDIGKSGPPPKPQYIPRDPHMYDNMVQNLRQIVPNFKESVEMFAETCWNNALVPKDCGFDVPSDKSIPQITFGIVSYANNRIITSIVESSAYDCILNQILDDIAIKLLKDQYTSGLDFAYIYESFTVLSDIVHNEFKNVKIFDFSPCDIVNHQSDVRLNYQMTIHKLLTSLAAITGNLETFRFEYGDSDLPKIIISVAKKLNDTLDLGIDMVYEISANTAADRAIAEKEQEKENRRVAAEHQYQQQLLDQRHQRRLMIERQEQQLAAWREEQQFIDRREEEQMRDRRREQYEREAADAPLSDFEMAQRLQQEEYNFRN